MSKWNEINKVLKTAYLQKESEYKVALHALLKESKTIKDADILRGIVSLTEQLEYIDDKQRILWLTSNINNNFYPPVNVVNASPVPWNSLEENKLTNSDFEELNLKYPLFAPLSDEANFSNDSYLEQNKDISDCSLVASLINIRQMGCNSPSIKKLNHGLYHLNFCFNGSTNRLVTVDTTSIPTNEEGQQLSLRSYNIIDKVIELAYLQVFITSYITSGSNVAIDTYRLTGFIPEVCKPDKFSFDKLSQYYKNELCFMALGTHALETIDALSCDRLITDHDYSVIGFDSVEGQILLRDPLDSKSRISINYNTELNNNFRQLYVNWNPKKLFKNEKTTEFFYNRDIYNKFDSILCKPMFRISNNSSKTETVWVLLETHIENNANALYNDETEIISYLQGIPKVNLFDKVFPPTDSAVNIGLQLLKLELPSKLSKDFFVHSTVNSSFTIHAYSITSLISLVRINADQFVKKSKFKWKFPIGSKTNYETELKDYLLNGKRYYLNPTFEIEVLSTKQEEVYLSFQGISRQPQDLLNLQIYHLADKRLERPILYDDHYKKLIFSKASVPIVTNTKYQIVCSRYTNQLNLGGEYIMFLYSSLKINDTGNSNLQIRIHEIFTEYGGLAYQLHKEVRFPSMEKRKKLHLLNNDRLNEAFVRIQSDDSRGKGIRCNIFDGETHETIVYDEKFYMGGLIISDLRINSEVKEVILLLELEEITDSIILYQVYIGSKWKLLYSE